MCAKNVWLVVNGKLFCAITITKGSTRIHIINISSACVHCFDGIMLLSADYIECLRKRKNRLCVDF